MFTKILVPIDGSPNSYKALEYATGIALKCNASITLINVVERPYYGAYAPEAHVSLDEAFALIKKDNEKLLSKKKEEMEKMGLKVDTILTEGNPAEQVLKIMKNYDLIVMGSRGHSPVKELLLGSVSTKVVHHASKPVLIIR